MTITLEIDDATHVATAYRDGKPIAVVVRRRPDRTGIVWSGYDLKGNVLFATMLNLGAQAMVRRIERALLREKN